MVKIKRTTLIVLILSFSLSLMPNFSYNKIEGAADPCEAVSCPPCKIIDGKEVCCEKKYHEETGTCVCINCPIECSVGSGKFENKSCLPAEGTGEWTFGTEIPIGEIIDRSSFLALKMSAEFEGIIKAGGIMVETTNLLLKDLPNLNCSSNCPYCGCYKYLSIFNWELTEGPAEQCASGPQPPGGLPAKEECQGDASQCETCEECRASGSCCWNTTFAPDPEFPENTITCKYCPQAGGCQEGCSLFRCGGCCGQYFDPVINASSDIEGAQGDLKNDINETGAPEKFRRSYILEQLDFARCELAKCWIPAEDYPDILAGTKVGKYLFTCKTVSDSGLFEDDQLTCLVLQATDELEEIIELWSNVEHWWDWPVVFFKTVAIAGVNPTTWRTIWGIILEWFGIAKEEGCYPTNYYCGQM